LAPGVINFGAFSGLAVSSITIFSLETAVFKNTLLDRVAENKKLLFVVRVKQNYAPNQLGVSGYLPYCSAK
jgi:hypothetical protein